MRTRGRRLGAMLLILGLTTLLLPPSGASGDSAGESIGVSGHWVIEVRDPDGRLGERREFHNALHASNPISQVLTSQRSAGAMEILLTCGSSSCAPPCGAADCRIIEPRQGVAASTSVFKNLTVASVAGGFQLKGFAVVGADAQIGFVATRMTTCLPTVAAASCALSVGNAQIPTLTAAGLGSPVPVVAGQQVLVTVTLGFATAPQ